MISKIENQTTGIYSHHLRGCALNGECALIMSNMVIKKFPFFHYILNSSLNRNLEI